MLSKIKMVLKQFYEIYRDKDPFIHILASMPLNPVSRRFGLERGKAADRYYIEKFLEDNKSCIHGDIMEIADNLYTYMFGTNIKNAFALHVNGWGENAIKGNLETGEGIIQNSIDCLICTQTMEHIFDCQAVVDNIYKLLKEDGVALITVGGIKSLSLYDYDNWGEYWKFTKKNVTRTL